MRSVPYADRDVLSLFVKRRKGSFLRRQARPTAALHDGLLL